MEFYGGGALGKGISFWLSYEGLFLLRGWAGDGLTLKQIAANMGVNRSTLCRYRKKHSSIDDCFKEGKMFVDYEVENALREKALSGDMKAIVFWLENKKNLKPSDEGGFSVAGGGASAGNGEEVCIVDDL